jgi:hypothetical protein
MDVESLGEPQTVTVRHPDWLSPEAVYGRTFGPTQTVTLTWSLRPPDDAIVNGGFETGLDGWSAILAPGAVVAGVAEPVHTGHHALALTCDAQVSTTAAVSQTVVLTDAWEPALSFWYQPTGTDPDDVLTVSLTLVSESVRPALSVSRLEDGPTFAAGRVTSSQTVTTTQVFTPAMEIEGWQHVWYYLGWPERAVTGTVTVRLGVGNDGEGVTTTVYVDEVSLGATPGGPHRLYLPLVLR